MNARRFRGWRGLLAAVAILLLGAFGTGWYLLAGSRARLDGGMRVAGVQAPVEIQRDALGTVTLSGRSRGDLDFALGYVHAQERWFEMDLARRVAAGELAELFGPVALPTDLEHRRHRLRAVAVAAYAQLPPVRRRELDRYRDGVNAGLAALRVRPWEYLLLRAQPRPWRSEDTLLVIAAMYLDLNHDGRNTRELRIAEMHAALPGALADFLLAPDPGWEAPLDGPLSPQPVPPDAGTFDLRRLPAAKPVAGLAAVLAPSHDARRPGSNNFAVAGTLTGTGAAMLANDMHLALRVPDIWFRTRLRYPDPAAPHGERDVAGVSLPGTPAMVVGSNGQIAWGFTNSYGDWMDWVRVQRDPHDPSRYKVPEGWASLQPHQEVIRVKGAAPRTLEVEDTRWGPIVAKDTDGTPLALAWIAQEPRSYNLDLMQLEHVASTAAALDLAPTFGMPPQNILVADAAGHVGWTIAGNGVPLRNGYDPRLPADWSLPGNGWTGWAAPAQYPRVLDPADGRLWTANNRTVGGDALALLGNGGHDLGARARQIRDDLFAHAFFTPGDLLDIQLDDNAVFLARWQHLLQDTLAGTREPALRQLRELTADWSGRADPDSVDYRLVRAFRGEVQDAVLAPFAARVKAAYPDFAWPGLGSPEAAVWMLVQRQPVNLLDPAYADWHALLLDAARRVAATRGSQPGGLAARRWGELNHAGIRHPLSRALPGFVARFLDMPDDELPGDDNMPRVASPGFGASERLAVSPGHEAQGILEMPGGQSDNPLSPYYGAGHRDWVLGRPTPLLPGPAQHTLTLEPAR
ncbi:penicillin acylase family protein [Rhodanobacter sp. DHB23]|uniref:penicillin acylase family protein n=1 Tax=Rhodanobacter sp. DHB23 TaxID=2775923 RepID=UPI001782901E|nr:penicillin acylase family protein [Rhodanobacter sp. DHB23]MBD8873073.1 penicillin acylase family protein [Rhodanobacter sp. DHB23]